MVSAWWLLVAFWVGGVLGLLLGAVAAAAARHPREDAEDGDGPQRQRDDGGGASAHGFGRRLPWG
jgi:hypothetical protein